MVYHPTSLENGIFVLWGDQEVSDGLAALEVNLYTMCAGDVFTVLTQPFGLRHHYVNVLFVNVGFSSCLSICNLMFSHLQDLKYLERQAFNRFSCLHQVLKKIFA